MGQQVKRRKMTYVSTLNNTSTSKTQDIPAVEKMLFISWAPNCSRSDNIARELGGKSFMIYHAFWGSNIFTIGLKYLTQSVETAWILLRHRPQRVICMSPPVPSLIPVWFYCLLFRGRFAIDYHTAAFVLRAQRALYFMQAFFARRATINLLTNAHLAAIVKGWGGKTMLISDVRVVFETITPYPNLSGGFNVTFVSRFSETEPLDDVYEAAKRLASNGVHFYVTGDLRDASEADVKNCPSNVTLTDFLSVPIYAGLLRDSDAVLCLCTNDNTMQRGAYEAMSVETPLVLSDWPILREVFSPGSVFVPNTVDGIVEGIQLAKLEHDRLSLEVKKLKQQRSERWDQTIVLLQAALRGESRA